MKALSLYQPWASLIAGREKTYETRSWQTTYRGPVIIHADQNKELLDEYFWQNYFRGRLGGMGYFDSAQLPLGAALCVADLVEIVRTEIIAPKLSTQELVFGNYHEGRFAWRFENVRAFKHPFPMRGQQGLFEANIDLEALLK